MLKRIFDTIISVIAISICLPLFLVIAILIRWQGAGPIFYHGVRVGCYGRLFEIFKFRTMVPNADRIGGPSTANDDPRITNVGRFLRRHKLDELPQLINVLKGEMSLVGPRPEVERYVNIFTEEEKAILSVKPGITDWASLWNSDEGGVLAGSPDPEKTYTEKIRPNKIRLQLKYVREYSFWVDVKILLETLRVVVLRKRIGLAK